MSSEHKGEKLDQVPAYDVRSELDAKEKDVKRNNMVQLYLRGTEVDNYIINNLYGKDKFVNPNNPNNTLDEQGLLEGLNLDETFTRQMQQIHRKTFYGITDPSDGTKRKMTWFESYIALV